VESVEKGVRLSHSYHINYDGGVRAEIHLLKILSAKVLTTPRCGTFYISYRCRMDTDRCGSQKS